jgi:dienelactone hydrolase
LDENENQAIIVIHEIYGINEFMQEQCQKFRNSGFAVFCPNMIGRPPFSYEKLAF